MEDPKSKGGRPPKPQDEKLVQRSIRLKGRQWTKIDGAGLDALRVLIDSWAPSAPKS